ncbi:MAG TPA: hypothetical protein VFZ25_07045 [Chloroflexota bacterium]|nr:hypothetical protein [Chloroflexota bacterium]
MALVTSSWFTVFILFLIPWGAGPLAGIVLAHQDGLPIPLTIGLYVLSDAITAVILEPLVQLVQRHGTRSAIGRRILDGVGKLGSVTQVTAGRFGMPLGLYTFCFATDFFTSAIVSTGLPMRRLTAWVAIIAGDVTWFLILFIASLGIASFLSDDRILFVVTLALGFALPPLMRRVLGRRPAATVEARSSDDKRAS